MAKAKVVGETRRVGVQAIEANGWNPNTQDDFMFGKERDSIREFGFLDPITVRSGRDKGPLFKKLEIIDGEHRLRAALAEGMTEVVVYDVGRMSDARARILGDVLNNTKGSNDPMKWAAMVTEVKAADPDLLQFLPYKPDALEAMLASASTMHVGLESGNEDREPAGAPKGDGKLFKKFSVSVPSGTMQLAQDIIRKIKAIRGIESDADAFKVMCDLANGALAEKRASIPPPAPKQAQQPMKTRTRRAASA